MNKFVYVSNDNNSGWASDGKPPIFHVSIDKANVFVLKCSGPKGEIMIAARLIMGVLPHE